MLSVGARDKLAVARAIMLDYARRSGLSTTDVPPHRYLWTDAFAVCNYVELHRRTEERRFLDLALALVDQLHHTLARFAPDDPREGWISGLPEAEGERHPTRGGLRIGKKLLERGADEPFDERLEWERDGQYFHYLTRWMHALDCVARVTEEVKYSRWALELARSAFRGFVQPQPASGGSSIGFHGKSHREFLAGCVPPAEPDLDGPSGHQWRDAGDEPGAVELPGPLNLWRIER